MITTTIEVGRRYRCNDGTVSEVLETRREGRLVHVRFLDERSGRVYDYFDDVFRRDHTEEPGLNPEPAPAPRTDRGRRVSGRGRERYRSCDRKIRYRSDYEAQQAAARYRRHRERDRIPVRSYECEHCNGYHLTSREERA